MPAKLSPDQVRRVLALQRRGWNQVRIAAELGLSPGTVCRRLKRLNDRAHDRLVADRRAEQFRVWVVLGHIVEESLDAWHNQAHPAPATEPLPTATHDARLLRAAREALADQRKLLGLDNPPAQRESVANEFLSAVEAAERADLDFEPDRPPDATAAPDQG